MATGNVVAGELYHELDGQLFEIKRQLRQLNGYPFNPVALRRHLQLAIEGAFPGAKYVTLRFLRLVKDDIRIVTGEMQKDWFWRETTSIKLRLLGEFRERVLRRIPSTLPPFDGALIKTEVVKEMWDSEIRKELDGFPQDLKSEFPSLLRTPPYSLEEIGAILPALLTKQAQGEAGDLDASGKPNMFYVHLGMGALATVFVSFDSKDLEWRCYTGGVEDGRRSGLHVFSRNPYKM